MNLFVKTLFIFACCLSANGQDRERIRILKTDEVFGSQSTSGPLSRLIGNVQIQTEKTDITCDSAWHYSEKRTVRAFGRIKILSGNDRIYAKELDYDLKQDVCTFFGPLVVVSPGRTLFTTTGTYFNKTNVANFTKPIFVRDEDGEIRADRGTFFTKSDSARLGGRVQLQDSSIYLEADSLISGKKSGLTRAKGSVFIEHTRQHWQVFAHYFNADSTKNRWFQDSVEYVKADSASSDTTWMASSRMHVEETGKKNSITATESVSMVHPDYSLRSDSLHYNESDGRFLLRKSPVLWTGRRQITAPLFNMTLVDNKLQLLEAPGRPFLTEKDSATGKLNQITADSLKMRFKDSDPEKMEWRKNVQMLFHTKSDSAKGPGLMVLAGTTLDIFFKSGRAERMKGSKDVSGYFSEKADSTETTRLNGFSWNPEKRPEKPKRHKSSRFSRNALDSLKQVFNLPKE